MTMEITASDFTDTFRMLSLFDGTNMEDVVKSLVNVSAPPSILYNALVKKLRICRPSMPAHQIEVSPKNKIIDLTMFSGGWTYPLLLTPHPA